MFGLSWKMIMIFVEISFDFPEYFFFFSTYKGGVKNVYYSRTNFLFVNIPTYTVHALNEKLKKDNYW